VWILLIESFLQNYQKEKWAVLTMKKIDKDILKNKDVMDTGVYKAKGQNKNVIGGLS